MSDEDQKQDTAGQAPADDSPSPFQPPPGPVSMPPPIGFPPVPGAAAGAPDQPPPDETPRQRNKREREEQKRQREAEKVRRRAEREQQKRLRAEQKAAKKGGARELRQESTDPPATQPAAESSISPAAEAAGLLIPPADPGLGRASSADEDSSQAKTAAFEPASAKPDRKTKREAKRQERDAAKQEAKTERQRVHEERRRAIEERRAQRLAAKSKADAAPEPPLHDSQEPAPALPVPPNETGDAGDGFAVAAAGLGVAGAGILAAHGESDTADESSDEPDEPAASTTDEPAAGTPDPDAPSDPLIRLESAEQREDDALVAAGSREAEADAERRVREVEGMRALAESRAADAQLAADDHARREAAASDEGELPKPLENELRLTDEQIDRRHRRDEELRAELDQTESRIESNRSRTEQALEEARERLERIESQAGEAEERAERAERLAEMRQQEAERERRLHEMLERINDAERRARDAESRARQAVAGVSRPFDPGSSLPEPLPPEPDPEPLDKMLEVSPPTRAAATTPTDEESSGAGWVGADATRPEDAAVGEEPADGVLPGSQANREAEDDSGDAARADARISPDFGNEAATEHSGGADPAELHPDAVDINHATFEQLRDAGLSVTQTGRVLAHRERAGGFRSIDELDGIPGFPREFLDQVKPHLTA